MRILERFYLTLRTIFAKLYTQFLYFSQKHRENNLEILRRNTIITQNAKDDIYVEIRFRKRDFEMLLLRCRLKTIRAIRLNDVVFESPVVFCKRLLGTRTRDSFVDKY